MPESPTSKSSDDQEPQKPRLSLRPQSKSDPDPQEVTPTPSQPDTPPTEASEETPLKKPSLRLNPNPSDTDRSVPETPTPPTEPEPPNPSADKPKKIGLKLKGIDTPTTQESTPTNDNEEEPSPSSPEVQASDAPETASTKTEKRIPQSTDDLPFSLPKEVKAPLPPFPLEEKETPETDPRTRKEGPKEIPKTVTFDDLEPAHSKKAPPPVNAPIHKGKVRKGKKKYLLLLFTLIIAGGLFYQFYLAPKKTSEELPPPTVETKTDAPASTKPGPVNPTPTAAPSKQTPTSEPSAAVIPEEVPESTPDPLIASIVDNLAITLVKASGSNPMIAINNIAYPIGSIVDQDAGLIFVGFGPERREIIFEDTNGSRYFRYY